MGDFWKNLKTWQKWFSFVAVLAVIVIIVVSIIMMNAPAKVKIVFAEKNNIPNSEITEIQNTMVGVLKNNTDGLKDFTTYTGNARDYHEESSDGISTADFVVDFDELKESYAVEVTWPDPNDGSPNIYISCPLYNSKYPETPCKTEINSNSEIESFLPYEGTIDGKKYEIAGGYDDGEFYLEIRVDSCGDTAILDRVLAAAKEWILSINLNPEDYLYYAPADICAANDMMTNVPYVQASHAKTKDANVNRYLPFFIPDAYNVYPATDDNGNVTAISAKIPGCMEYQREPGKNEVMDYLNGHGINYPVNFVECAE